MLYAEYANAEYFNNLLYGVDTTETHFDGFNSYLNINWQDFYNIFYNIYTATSYGLDNWGRILGVTRNIYIPIIKNTFGFGDSENPPAPPGPDGYPQAFNYGSFSSGGAKYTSLKDSQFRCVLLMRYRTLVSNMSILSIQYIMNEFFFNLTRFADEDTPNTQFVSVQDNLAEMSITYTFTQKLEPWQTVIFSSSQNPTNLLPRPLCVKAIVLQPT